MPLISPLRVCKPAPATAGQKAFQDLQRLYAASPGLRRLHSGNSSFCKNSECPVGEGELLKINGPQKPNAPAMPLNAMHFPSIYRINVAVFTQESAQDCITLLTSLTQIPFYGGEKRTECKVLNGTSFSSSFLSSSVFLNLFSRYQESQPSLYQREASLQKMLRGHQSTVTLLKLSIGCVEGFHSWLHFPLVLLYMPEDRQKIAISRKN